MTDLYKRICDAMVRMEGMPAAYMNPGNLRDAPWFPLRVGRTDPAGRYYFDNGELLVYHNGFWVPRSRVEGLAGLGHLVALHVGEGNTLTDFIAGHPGVYGGFAPGAADKNNPTLYIENVKQWAGIPDATVPLWTYLLPPNSVAPNAVS